MFPASPLEILLWSLILTVLFESLTLFLRFGFGFEWAAVSRSTVGVLTFGVRIHHCFVGLALLLTGVMMVGPWVPWRGLLLATGWGLVLSDLIHHFLILWPVTGRPQFHLLYRQSEPSDD